MSVRFMATSIAIIEISDMPQAVLTEFGSDICFNKMNVSKIIEVIKPLIMASPIIAKVGHAISKYWKQAMVPKSPIEQPIKHHRVL